MLMGRSYSFVPEPRTDPFEPSMDSIQPNVSSSVALDSSAKLEVVSRDRASASGPQVLIACDISAAHPRSRAVQATPANADAPRERRRIGAAIDRNRMYLLFARLDGPVAQPRQL